MSKLIALAQFLLALSGCSLGAETWSHRVAGNGGESLRSDIVAEDGIARFRCLASASGACHYTLYPAGCRNADCRTRPLTIRDCDLTLVSLAGANLAGVDLSGLRLREANLVRADLSGCDLRGAPFPPRRRRNSGTKEDDGSSRGAPSRVARPLRPRSRSSGLM